MCSQVSGTLLFSIFFTYVVITVIFKVVYSRLKSGVRKAELRGDSRQVRHWIHWNIFLERETSVYLCLLQAAPPAGHGQVSHLPTPSIPDMTAKVWIVIFDKQTVLSYFHWPGKPCFLSSLILPCQVNQGYLPDLAYQEQGGHQGHSQGAAFDEQDMEPVRPSRFANQLANSYTM